MKKTSLLAGILTLALTQPAVAGYISGDIGFGGAFTPTDSSFTATSLGTADGIDYTDDMAVVTLANGDFSGLLFSTVAMTDFVFDPFLSSVSLWTVGGFSFELTSVSILVQDDTTLSLSGTGTVSGAGFDTTLGTWNFTGNPAGASFTFSNGTGALAVGVPEPGSLVLLGAGLLAFGLFRYRRTG